MAQKIVVLPDVHYPFHDRKVWHGALGFIRREKPDAVGLIGDCYDFYDLSRFDKNPARLNNLPRDLGNPGEPGGFQREILAALAIAAPNAERWITAGNHEARLRKYLWHHAPAFSGFKTLTVPALYQTEHYGFTYHEEGTMVRLGKLRALHGHIVRKWSGMSAKAHFERHGTSILHGHSHRMGAFFKRDVKGIHGAWEIGCLCDLQPEYLPFPDWQQGWAVVTVGKRDLFSVELVSVIDRRFYVYGGQTYAL